jgi:xylan 1,4-beta-xylosidase
VADAPRPVIPGFHPDPSVVRVGADYYLVTSSFEYAPGVPIFHSRDLVEWEQIGHVLDRATQLDVSAAGASGGIFAPTIRHNDGRFWVITTNTTDAGGQLLVWADDPRGPWSDPVRIPEIDGIDPDLAWDDAGHTLVTWSSFDLVADRSRIRQVQIDPTTGTVLTAPIDLWSGTGRAYPEAPHLYRVDDDWYLMLAEGGTERGHSVVIARGATPQGPFEAAPNNPLLTHRALTGTLQNTGHADLVDRPDGSWAMVFLGVRVRGMSPKYHVLGRETFAADVEWQNGWPVVGRLLTPAADADRVVDSGVVDFSSELGLEWAASGTAASHPVAAVGDGSLILSGTCEADVFLGRRQEHLFADAVVTIAPSGGRGALLLRVDPQHEYGVSVCDGRVTALSQVGAVRAAIVERDVDNVSDGTGVPSAVAEDHTTVYVSVVGAASGSGAPDTIVMGYLTGGERVELARLDGRYLSTEVAGGFTGRFFGITACSGRPAFSRFRYRGSDSADALAAVLP